VSEWKKLLIDFAGFFEERGQFLAAIFLIGGTAGVFAGGAVWVTNVIAFALWFWDVDRGGAAERARGTSRTPAFVFPELEHK
jgi:hypothetical protein